MKFLACEDALPLLVPLADDELAQDQRAPVEAHLATCDRCREAREELDVLVSLLGKHHATKVDARVVEEVGEAIEGESTEPLERPRRDEDPVPVPTERSEADTDPNVPRRVPTEPYDAPPAGVVPTEEQPARLIGAVLGGYRIDSEIATGGMGTVYRATHLALDRPVAVKVLSRRLAASDTYLKRFLREARTAVSIDHPNITRVYDAGEEKDETFFVMELVQGEDAETFMVERKQVFSPRRAVEVALEVARALEAAHKAGVIHRDVKPANVLLTKSGRVKLADLGLAKLEEGTLAGDAKLTGRKVVMGSPNYMAPEQAEDARNAEARSDVFALGATLYHLVTGIRPFGTGTSLEVIGRVVDPTPLEIPERAADGSTIDPGLRTILAKACEKHLNRRYASATAFREDLEAYSRYVEAAHATTPVPQAPSHSARRSGRFQSPARSGSRRFGDPARGPDSSKRVPAIELPHVPRTGRIDRSGFPAIAIVAAAFLLAIVAFFVIPRRDEPREVEPRSEISPVSSETSREGDK